MAPELGDTQRDLWPELYVKLAKYLKPIRVTSTQRMPSCGTSPSTSTRASEDCHSGRLRGSTR